jgi:hypothetical protein
MTVATVKHPVGFFWEFAPARPLDCQKFFLLALRKTSANLYGTYYAGIWLPAFSGGHKNAY